ncbi:MAG TPA: aminotransferase class I/II-fold pyridoxal phosphate-dependent enzyme [Gaiellaceae bacterium]|jgi:acetylornithine aminotransferase|nr:aminotransferase class I/II-fold pyridoxal phosphate-dependent enzyme [Gaiellaceae bacterium]
MHLSPLLAELSQYPFARLDAWRAEARARGVDVIDFGVGDPREPTPSLVREALVAGLRDVSSYPRAVGLPEYRAAVAAWLSSRFGVETDPDVEIVPTLGSKEAIFSFAQMALGDKRVVAVPEPGYPVYERGALFAGAQVMTVPLREGAAWLPDLDAIDFWDEIGLFWTCYPNNPTGATAPLSFYEELAGRAREHGFLLCSDEAYSELWFGEEPASALQVANRENVVVFNTLSKRSSMTGYRCGFVCAPPVVADALRAFRPTVGTAPQEFVQRAGVAALGDETHVEAVRDVYRRKRDALLPILRSGGLRLAGGDATFFLWLAVDGPSEAFAVRLLDEGILVAPGSFFGPAGEGYVRMALVPTEAECERAGDILAKVL